MTTEFRLPDLGEDVTSGDVLSLLVSEGDDIQVDQGVLELETDKATVEVPCSVAGRITRIHIAEGQTVDAGAGILSIEESAVGAADSGRTKKTKSAPAPMKQPVRVVETTSSTAAPEAVSVAPAQTAQVQAAQVQAAQVQAAQVQAAPAASKPPKPSGQAREEHGEEHREERREEHGRAPAGPAVRRMARELGVDLALVPASDPSGRITKEDVTAYVRETTAKAASVADPASGRLERDRWGAILREPLSKIRQTIARKMVESYTTIPQLTNFDDADITELEQIRQTSKKDYERRGIKLTTLPFLIKALASALKSHSGVNASLDSETAEIIYKKYVSIGVAVDTPRGLVVPVIRNVDEMNIPQIAHALAELATSAREGRYTVDDLRGGTFTISNLGAVGGTYSTPLINPPEVAILLPGRARTKPVYVDERVEPRLMLPLSLTYDHRVVDGAVAARFLNEVKGYLEAPGRLLLAI